MRSVTYNEFGKPSDVLRIEDRPTPETKAGEVRIKTILSSIHNHCLLYTSPSPRDVNETRMPSSA